MLRRSQNVIPNLLEESLASLSMAIFNNTFEYLTYFSAFAGKTIKNGRTGGDGANTVLATLLEPSLVWY